MWIFVVLVASATFVGMQAHPVSLEEKEKFLEYHIDCRVTSGVEEKIITKFCIGEEVDDPKLKDYLFCMSKIIGFQNEDGQLQVDVIKEKLSKHEHNLTEIETLVEKCAVQKESSLETAYSIFKCYRENVPNYTGVLYVASITPVKTKKLLKYHKECVEETKIDEHLLEKKHNGEYSEDPTLKQYLLCITKKLGFQDADGKIQRDVIKEKLSGLISEDRKVEKLMELCVSEKENPESTAHAMIKCFDEKSYITILPPIPLPQEKAEKLFVYYRECKKQIPVDKNLLIKASIGDFTDDSLLKEYFLCMSKKVGFQNEDGVLQKDVLKQKIADILNDTVASEKLLEKCAVQEDSPTNTAYNTVKCYYENTPNHTSIFREPPLTLSAEKKEKLVKYNSECMTESNVDPEIIEQVKKGTFPEDEKLKDHLFCFYKKLGLQNDAGEIQKKQLCRKIGTFLGDPTLSEKLVEKCAVQMDTPANTAFKAFVCYYENTPSHFNILSIF